jgi:hypothetical protein
MEDTNPQGSVTVRDAAQSFLGMMEPQEPQGQPEAEPEQEQPEAEQSEEVEYEAASEEVQEEVQETPRYRVKVDGEEMEVELDELLNGYQRTSDYTKKTQLLSEQRKVVEAERTKIEEAAKLRDQYAERLQIIEQMLTQPEEDINSLKDNDPIGYAVKMAERVERDKQLAAVREERQKVLAQQQAEQQQHLQTHLSQEAERLKAAIPEMTDVAKAPVVQQEIRTYAKSIGFSDQELASVYDHRAVVALYKAMQYDKLQRSKPGVAKKVAEAPKTLKPGTIQAPRGDEAANRIRKQLKQSGKTRDAAALFERLL